MNYDQAMFEERLSTANRVLDSFAPGVRIERRRGGFYVVWKHWRDENKETAKRWLTRGQDFYPPWSHQYPGGGTSCTALSQLIRWLRGQPVLPLATWRYWGGEKVFLGQGNLAVAELASGGYPEHATCVLCGRQIEGGMDWWNLDGVSGPCCAWTTGCRQRAE